MLTLEEMLRIAADRGLRLKLVTLKGHPFITDGISRPYPCPASYLHGTLPMRFIYGFCRHFGLPPVDFSLDADDD